MGSFHAFIFVVLGVFSQLVTQQVHCEDKLFIADFYVDAIYMMKSDGVSFVNSSLVSLNLTGLVSPFGVEYDHRTDIVYWTDRLNHTINRAAVDGSFQQVLHRLPSSLFEYYPHGIALDLEEEKVYWVDKSRGLIERSNLDGTNVEEVVDTGFNSAPEFIVFSKFRRKIFWTNDGTDPKIEMANPDGTGREVLVDSLIGSLNGLCLDFSERILYWTDAANDTIENIHLDNMMRHHIKFTHSSISDLFPFGIAKYFEDIYFTDLATFGVFAVEPSGIHRVANRVSQHAEIHIYADASCDGANLCADSGSCIIVRKLHVPSFYYVCICKPGYTGEHCDENIDECLQPNICGLNEYCINTVGGYSCHCSDGYERTNGICIDIDECLQPNICGLNEYCINTEGGYSCYCSDGFERKNGICMDINDCLQRDICGLNEHCINTEGGHSCNCSDGFERKNGICMDIDECLQRDICGLNEYCINTEGGHSCNCSDGYERKNGICMVSQLVGGFMQFSRLNGQLVSFSDALEDPSSDDYRILVSQCYDILFEVVTGIMKTYNSPWELSIIGFRRGSIFVDFKIEIFDASRDTLRTQAVEVETSLGGQIPGVWTTADESISIKVESLVSVGGVCLGDISKCGGHGSCRTNPGDSNYWCLCEPGYTGAHCESEVTCDLPNEPFSHVLNPKGSYSGDERVTIQCDEKDLSVVWICNGTSGTWDVLAEINCESGESGFPTAAIIGIVVGVLVIIIIGFVLCFLYKCAGMKLRTRSSHVDRQSLASNNYQPGAFSNPPAGFPPEKSHGTPDIYEQLSEERRVKQGTLPSIPLSDYPRGEPAGAKTFSGFPDSKPPDYSAQDATGTSHRLYDVSIKKVAQTSA